TKDELIDYAIRTGAPLEVVENLQDIEDEGESYDSIQEIWPDYPTDEDYLWNEEEYENCIFYKYIRKSLFKRLFFCFLLKSKSIYYFIYSFVYQRSNLAPYLT